MYVCMYVYIYISILGLWICICGSRAVAQRHFINLGTTFLIKCVVTPSMPHAKRRVLEDADELGSHVHLPAMRR